MDGRGNSAAAKRPLRKDWESVKDSIMHPAVRARLAQHAGLREVLPRTGDATIVEHTENDAYWGDGGDGSGRNRLGQILNAAPGGLQLGGCERIVEKGQRAESEAA